LIDGDDWEIGKCTAPPAPLTLSLTLTHLGKAAAKTGHVFTKEGAIGKEFEAEGAIGATADAAGGPLDEAGAVGRQFKSDGSIGGTVEAAAGSVEGAGEKAVRHGEQDKRAGKGKA
jgi:hypothetical protein